MLLLKLETLSPVKQRMVIAMQNGAKRHREIADAACASSETVRHYIRELMRDGVICRTSRGCYALDCYIAGQNIFHK
jgi:predicted transcriptional regulator